MSSKKSIVIFLAFVVLNNIAWVLVKDWAPGKSHDVENTGVSLAASEERVKCLPQPQTDLSVHAREVRITEEEKEVADEAPVAADADNSDFGEVPAELDDRAEIPVALSQQVQYERELNALYFFNSDSEKKIQTLETLSPQGSDLALLREIVELEEDTQIRVAAIQKLSQQNNYVATTTLIDALDDPTPEVALAALSTIVENGDRTLLPVLEAELSKRSANDPAYQEFEKLVRTLEYSVTMQMDDVPPR